jgi:hypothetical protein
MASVPAPPPPADGAAAAPPDKPLRQRLFSLSKKKHKEAKAADEKPTPDVAHAAENSASTSSEYFPHRSICVVLSLRQTTQRLWQLSRRSRMTKGRPHRPPPPNLCPCQWLHRPTTRSKALLIPLSPATTNGQRSMVAEATSRRLLRPRSRPRLRTRS